MQEALPLTVPNHSKTDEVSITALDFPHSETSTFWVGTEEGSIYQANRYDQPSRKAGISTSAEDIYRGHAGPVTGLHFHPSTGSIDFGDLFLTSSVDWSVKLWRAGAGGKGAAQKAASQPAAPAYSRSASERVVSTSKEAAVGQQSLHSFESADDYVFDVKWHPHHPAMFGAVDGSGKFDLWNLNQDTEVCACRFIETWLISRSHTSPLRSPLVRSTNSRGTGHHYLEKQQSAERMARSTCTSWRRSWCSRGIASGWICSGYWRG